MSEKNFTQEQEIGTKSDRTKKAKIKTLISYLREKHSCEFPDNYARMLFRMGMDWVPSKKVADAIILEWLEWEPYVDPESFQGFVQYELELLLKIHTTSTFGSPNLNEYIGNKAKVIKAPPYSKATTVYMDGNMVAR